MKNPSVSIIISIYRDTPFLSECMESILSQTFADFELIIIIDGSTHHAIDAIRTYRDDRIRLITQQDNWVQYPNTCSDLIRGKYITPMDPDSTMQPHRLEIQYNYMENNPDVDICGGWMLGFDQQDIRYTPPIKHEEIIAGLLFENQINNPTAMLRADKLHSLFCYPDFYTTEAYNLWVDLAIQGFRFANIPEILINCRKSRSPFTTIHKHELPANQVEIQTAYLEYVLEKIVQTDQDLFNFIDYDIDLYNNKKLSIDSLRSTAYDIFNAQLEEQRQRNKIKILFCIETLGGGGAEKVLIDILKHMDYEVYCVDLLVCRKDGVYFIDIPSQVKWFTPDNMKGADYSYDVEVAFLEGWAVRYINRRNSEARKIAWIHIDLLNFHWTKRFYSTYEEEKNEYALFDTIVFVSDDVRCQFNKLFPGLTVPQRVIYNLIDRMEINRKAGAYVVKKEKLTICSVGRLTPQKGYSTLMEVMHLLTENDNPDCELWLVGAGEEKEALEKLIDQYALTDVVNLKGFQKNPYPYIKAADIFVSTSVSEGYPLVICEALALGKPIVATRISGTREILDNGKYGVLVEPDAESIYVALKKMIMDWEMRDWYTDQAVLRSQTFEVTQTMSEIYRVLQLEQTSI